MNGLIWRREQQRREALWKLQSLEPGDPAARPWIEVLDDIDQQELNDPIGIGYGMMVAELRLLVPTVEVRSFKIVREENIPSPWRERFLLASRGSTRLPEGCYSCDWRRFLQLWAEEIAHLKQHRMWGKAND